MPGRARQHRQRLFELEIVEVAGNQHLGVRIGRQRGIDEVVHGLRLRGALDLAGVERRVVGAVERAAATLGGEVVVDDRDLFTVEREGGDQRRPRIEERIVGIGLLVGVAGRIGDWPCHRPPTVFSDPSTKSTRSVR